jgi:hypothetical protein
MILPFFGKQEVGICFPQYGVLIWSLWPNIRFLPSIVAEKNATKNEHIYSMCIKINKIGKIGSKNLMGSKTLPTIWGTYTSCLPTLLIFILIEHTFCICPFLVTFFSATIDGRNLIFGHKHYIGTLYRGKRFLTRQIPTSCLPKSGGIIGEH